MTADGTALCTIGAFASLVGVTPSALRYYDDCGLLAPAHTDPHTGYRRYAPVQRRRAVLIRLLRDAGMPVPQVRRVVDDPDAATPVLAAHASEIAAQADAATAALREATRLLEAGPAAAAAVPGLAAVGVSGPALACGIRQVAPATGPPGSPAGLAGIRVELSHGELRLVASDRYRLAVRTLPVTAAADGAVAGGVDGAVADGAPTGATVDAGALRRLVPDLLGARTVVLRTSPSAGDRLRLSFEVDGASHALPAVGGAFPDHRAVLGQWLRADTTLVVARDALHAALGPRCDGAVVRLGAGSDTADGAGQDRGDHITVEHLHGGAMRTLPGAWRGGGVTACFDTGHLTDAVAASVGPDVIIGLAAGPLPATVRSADHGAFTAVAMPRAEER